MTRLLFFMLLASGCLSLQAQDYIAPVAKKIPHTDSLFGNAHSDPYNWMRNKYDPDFINYLSAENAYADRVMSDSRLLSKKIFEEMRAKIKESSSSTPVKRKEYYYYFRYKEGQDYPIYCRKKDSLTAPEQILLDGNQLAREHNYFTFQFLQISPDHNYLAYGINSKGGDAGTLYVKDLANDSVWPDEIEHVGGIVWANDNRTLFYIWEDPKTKRANRVIRHKLGTPNNQDVLVLEETRKGYFPQIGRSTSGDYLFLTTASFISSATYYLSSENPEGDFKLFAPAQPNVMYAVNHFDGGEILVQTNENAINGQLLQAPEMGAPRETWKSFLAHRDSVILQGYSLFKDYVVVNARNRGHMQIEVRHRHSDSIAVLGSDNPVSTNRVGSTGEYDEQWIRYSVEQMTTPWQSYHLDLTTGKDTLIEQDTVLKHDPSQYRSKRIWAPSRDGQRIAIDLVYHRNTALDGSAPVMMNAYGSYGVTIDPDFSVTRLSYLDRGFIWAVPHVRGESFLGQAWHDDGKMLNKINTFNDVVDATEYLIAKGYSQAGRIAIQGGSAGGLLVGAVINQRPDLYGVAIASVPFVDVINDMLDVSWPGIVAHFDEIGNPRKKAEYEHIKSYCPYYNVKAQDYPPLLVTNGYNDSRVPTWAPAKWAAKLRDLKTDSNLVLLKTEMEAGHFGPSGRYGAWKKNAWEMAFVMRALGIRENYIEVRGRVVDVEGEALPFVNVFVNGSTHGTTTNLNGEFLIELKEEELTELAFQYIGYEKHVEQLTEATKTSGLNVTLRSEDIQLPQFTVSAKAKDPAFGIIKNAIARRKFHRDQVQSFSGDLYMKGAARINEIPEKLPKFLLDEPLDSNDLGLVYLSESVARFHSSAPDDYKEEMFASKVAGEGQGFSWNRAQDVLFNFYDNTLAFKDVSEREFVSPIASTALIYYKYRLAGTFYDEGRLVNKIEVIPRRKSDPIFLGYIYIYEDTWNIHSIDVKLTKASQIEFVDTIAIAQSYLEVEDSIFMPFALNISYDYKVFGIGATFKAVGMFSNYRLNRSFPPRFFRNEVFRIEKGANRQDSTYWVNSRPIVLTEEELENYRKGDSLELVHNSRAYKDSIDAERNKFDLMETLFLGGYSRQNTVDSLWYGVSSVANMIQFNTVEGTVINVNPRFWRPRQMSATWGDVDLRYSTAREKFNAQANLTHRFNRINFNMLRIQGGHYVAQYNPVEPIAPVFNSLYTLIDRRNYMKIYEKSFGKVSYSQDVVNGLNMSGSVEYAQRTPLNNQSDYSWTSSNREYTPNIVPDYPVGPQNALTLELGFTYKFKQKFETWPNRKINLGSKYPTLYFNYRKGINGLGSDVNYDLVTVGIGDNLKGGMLGVSMYDVIAGRFFNNSRMGFYDYQHFNGNQTHFLFIRNVNVVNENLRTKLRNFNTLDYYSHSTSEGFVEGHFQHHFRGFILNKVPFVRKMKWQTVAGVNALWTEDQGDYSEVYVGIENIFRILRVDFVSSYETGEQLEPQFRIGLDLGL